MTFSYNNKKNNNRIIIIAKIAHTIISHAQALYALRVLRAHCMDDSSLQTIYRSVIISKLTYASSAWWGFTSTVDRQRLEAFIRRSHRSRCVPHDLPAFADICLSADEKLFSAVIRDIDHVLHKLLPPLSTASQSYNLREGTLLRLRTGRLSDHNFIERMLYYIAVY